MTSPTADAPQMSVLDAQLQLEVAVQQLLTPQIQPLDRNRAENDPAVAQVNADADRVHADRMAQYRAQHRAARARRDKAGARRALSRMLEAEQIHRDRRHNRRSDRAIIPSLLTRLQAAVESTGGHGNRSAGVHRAVLNLDAAELLGHIEHTIGRCLPGEILHSRLRYWSAQYADAEPADLARAAARATSWVDAARAILEPDRTFEVQGACPVCGERYVYVQSDDGTRVRRAALQISYGTRSARCINPSCDGRWTADYLHHLADVVEQDVHERKPTR